MCSTSTGIIFCMHRANERWCYNVTSSHIGWALAQIYPCINPPYASPMSSMGHILRHHCVCRCTRNLACLGIGRHKPHDDVIKWKHFPLYWPFVRGIHRSPVNSPHKGQWRGALMFTLICARINGWVNNREAGDLRRYRAHYDVIVMQLYNTVECCYDMIQYSMELHTAVS